MLLTDEYKQLISQLHKDDPMWGNGPAISLPDIYDFVRKYNIRQFLDYGCGKGMVRKIMSGYDVTNYDPAIPEFANFPKYPKQAVICVDVLEHVEEQCLDAVLQSIAHHAIKYVFLAICTEPAGVNLPDGRNAHITIHDHVWWINKLSEYFDLVECNCPAKGDVLNYIGKPRK